MPVRLATRSWDGKQHGELVADPRNGPDGAPRVDGTSAGPAAAPGHDGAAAAPGHDGAAAAPGREGAGGGGPLAVLIHGVTSSSRTWWRLAPELVRRGYRVLALDLRGHGASPPAGDELVLGDLTVDVVETLGAAAPPRAGDGGPAIDLLIGHSLGALVALDLLAKVPGVARRLVLEDPPGPTGVDWAIMSEGIIADGHRARSEPEAMRRELVAANPDWVPEEVDRRLADLAACDADGVAAALSRTTAFDLIGLAGAVQVPALLAIGLEELGSALVGPDRAALVAALRGRADVEVLQTGHNLHREAFTRYLEVLDRWLDATAGVGRR